MPVRVRKTRQIKNLERSFRFHRNEGTRQYLPGRLLINGLEILRLCCVGYPRAICRDEEIPPCSMVISAAATISTPVAMTAAAGAVVAASAFRWAVVAASASGP